MELAAETSQLSIIAQGPYTQASLHLLLLQKFLFIVNNFSLHNLNTS